MRRALFAAALVAAGGLHNSQLSNAEETQRVAYSRSLGVEAFAVTRAGTWCGPTVDLRVVAEKAEFFTSTDLKELVRRLGGVVRLQCAEADELKLLGVQKGASVVLWRGEAKADHDWAVAALAQPGTVQSGSGDLSLAPANPVASAQPPSSQTAGSTTETTLPVPQPSLPQPSLPPIKVADNLRPIVLTIDGIDPNMTASGAGGVIRREKPVSRATSYLQPAVRSGWAFVKDEDVRYAPWSGDYYETPEFIESVKDAVALQARLARQRNQPFVVIGHSWGTVLGYRAIFELYRDKRLRKGDIDQFVTLGSPISPRNALTQTATPRHLAWHGVDALREPVRLWHNYWIEADVISNSIEGLQEPNDVRLDYDPTTDGRDAHNAYWKSPRLWHRIGQDVAQSLQKTRPRGQLSSTVQNSSTTPDEIDPAKEYISKRPTIHFLRTTVVGNADVYLWSCKPSSHYASVIVSVSSNIDLTEREGVEQILNQILGFTKTACPAARRNNTNINVFQKGKFYRGSSLMEGLAIHWRGSEYTNYAIMEKERLAREEQRRGAEQARHERARLAAARAEKEREKALVEFSNWYAGHEQAFARNPYGYEGSVEHFLIGLRNMKFHFVFETEEAFRLASIRLKGENPKMLWKKALQDYYFKEKSLFDRLPEAKGPYFRNEYWNILTSAQNYVYGRIIDFVPRLKEWKIIETKRTNLASEMRSVMGLSNPFLQPRYRETGEGIVIYAKFWYPDISRAPKYKGKKLKEAVFKFLLNDAGYIIGITGVISGFVYW